MILPVLGVATSRASAQDFFHPGTTAATVARGGIYEPRAEDVLDAIALNPAGLSEVTTPAANAVVIAGLGRGSFLNAANHGGVGDSRLAQRPDLGFFGAIGTRLGVSRWSFGAGVTPDFLSSVNWHYSDTPGTGGADYGSQREKSELAVTRGAAGIALAVNRQLSIGVTGGVVYDSNTLVTPFIFQSNPALRGLKTLLSLHTRGLGWGGSLGLLARPTPAVTLSAAYSSPYNVDSHGHALGSLSEQFAVLGIPFPPDFTYSAHVGVKLPQSVTAGVGWQITPSLMWSLRGDFNNFSQAFRTLPVSLSHGSNSDINAFLGSDAIRDEVPLKWSDQYALRSGLDYQLGSHYQVIAGLAVRSNLVPKGTLTPLTGAIMKDTISGGLRYERGGCFLTGAYANSWNHSESVPTSSLLAGEYSASKLTIGSQSLTVDLSCRTRGRHPASR